MLGSWNDWQGSVRPNYLYYCTSTRQVIDRQFTNERSSDHPTNCRTSRWEAKSNRTDQNFCVECKRITQVKYAFLYKITLRSQIMYPSVYTDFAQIFLLEPILHKYKYILWKVFESVDYPRICWLPPCIYAYQSNTGAFWKGAQCVGVLSYQLVNF